MTATESGWAVVLAVVVVVLWIITAAQDASNKAHAADVASGRAGWYDLQGNYTTRPLGSPPGTRWPNSTVPVPTDHTSYLAVLGIIFAVTFALIGILSWFSRRRLAERSRLRTEEAIPADIAASEAVQRWMKTHRKPPNREGPNDRPFPWRPYD